MIETVRKATIIYHLSTIIYQLTFINYHLFTIMKKELWQKILQIAITVLTAIATTFGVTSCMGL